MPDMTITCVDCGSDFTFSERDQAFFAERGMSTPKRCRECRAARKAQGGGAGAPRGGDRVRHPIVCQQCGKEDTVPFKPTAGRPVLCRDCFSAGRR
ncbi:MAG TPA: zinc-ribbon domain containing protein [Acidobacteriota bacterium]|nr:zinc-ribbon domain containing protein [bacterium]HNX20034.1 zinc-ribbon domain containing protein [Acidobacteriota bacterium]